MDRIQFLEKPQATHEEMIAALDRACTQVEKNLPEFTYQYQSASSTDLFYQPIINKDWTNGFWTGEIWLAYEHTKKNIFKYAALIQVEDFYKRIHEEFSVDHHDLGFLYSLSCVAGWKLTGDETAKQAAILAAEKLITRFQEKGEFIQAWGEMGDKNSYRLIIDCLLNLPLLYWASEVTGDPKFADIAHRHIRTAMKCVVREDYSTIHTYFFDPETGLPLKGVTHQGNRDNSAWARGQAWGVYGTILSYQYTQDPEYLELFRHISDYYLRHLPEDLIPFWDFDFTDGSSEPRDSSSAAIVICGFLEAAKVLEPEEAQYYTKLARQMMKSLIDNYEVKDWNSSNGILLHSTYNRHTPTNTCRNKGVDECCSWGDYYYMEALTRMVTDWNRYW